MATLVEEEPTEGKGKGKGKSKCDFIRPLTEIIFVGHKRGDEGGNDKGGDDKDTGKDGGDDEEGGEEDSPFF